MRDNTGKFLNRMNAVKLDPAKTCQRVNGTVICTWYVDDNDDRYVEVSDSVRSNDLLVVCRDHTLVEAAVVPTIAQAESAVRGYLEKLSGRDLSLEVRS